MGQIPLPAPDLCSLQEARRGCGRKGAGRPARPQLGQPPWTAPRFHPLPARVHCASPRDLEFFFLAERLVMKVEERSTLCLKYCHKK